MSIVKRLASWILGDYDLYRIYQFDLSRAEGPPSSVARLAEVDERALVGTDLRDLAQYAGTGAHGFGAWLGSDLAATCWFWNEERYRQRNFWPIQNDEAKLVQISTAEHYQGRGIAFDLIRFGMNEMKTRGYRRVYARVWHSNRPSIGLFEKAGWKYVAFVARVSIFRLAPMKLVCRVKIRR